MKLLTFQSAGGPRVGVRLTEGVVDLTAALAETHPELTCTGSLLHIIESAIDIDALAAASIERLHASNRLAEFVVDAPRYLPPIVFPSKILALALNYPGHIVERNLHFKDEPIIFTKYTSNLIAHDDDIELPPFPQLVEEEHELALVVGRDCRHITAAQAPAYIFGYTICNDVSARDRQDERRLMGQPYDYAKNFATFCPMGPWVVTRSELPDPRDLAMEVRVNGTVTRRGNSREMIFDPYVVLAYCSDYTEMRAGDVISLGTFEGDKRLQAGDVVELEIEKIGVLRNRVVEARGPWRSFPPNAPTGPLVNEA